MNKMPSMWRRAGKDNNAMTEGHDMVMKIEMANTGNATLVMTKSHMDEVMPHKE